MAMKILVVRFSSIGDIVLTTPVLTAIKNQCPDCEIHFLTKKAFSILLENNTQIDKLYTIEKSIDEVVNDLKEENYTHVVDLHNNLRTRALQSKLKVKTSRFPKLNIKKWWLVRFKIDRLPKIHVVDRYFQAVRALGVTNQGEAIHFSIAPHNEVDVKAHLGLAPKTYRSVALGAQFRTKQMPVDLLVKILQKIEGPIVLVGGPTDEANANEVINRMNSDIIYNATGLFNVQESASIVKQSLGLLTNDTGMMHIAAGLNVPITSVWGNTVPEFGMYPYLPKRPELFSIHEVKGLSCRPCSKIGFQECPKKHFDCMNKQNADKIASDFEQR